MILISFASFSIVLTSNCNSSKMRTAFFASQSIQIFIMELVDLLF